MLQRIGSAVLMAAATAMSLVLCAAGTADAAPRAQRVATVYEHANYQGASIDLYADECVFVSSQRNLPSAWNDRISSIQMHQPCAMVVFEHSGIAGASTWFWASQNGLGPWNDRISSYAFSK
ncbi:beta and gamma crystallin [Streptomyces clavuligerus]|uniref:beta and gamma crystallin n=1 Tax=Streptomyces clavuligerus TaxID=1901 RepID=UPI00020D9485|nr:beta and gamma crystallin [Streptomyces clavuligerus]MBY6307471.1 hypothetical protein [Streptomyces clavuligerus]QCS09969.1 hypothetical protein CRV15_30760 [Streptomyces clavuligerus]QPJ97988.1 hypothetical protein GE265_33675 [Streptomyces clavuligerus]WDN56676.1 hypothetical protein LL058_33205 [Streptomyces clavuligerus]